MKNRHDTTNRPAKSLPLCFASAAPSQQGRVMSKPIAKGRKNHRKEGWTDEEVDTDRWENEGGAHIARAAGVLRRRGLIAAGIERAKRY